MQYQALRELLFTLPAEWSHHVSLQSMALLERLQLASLIARDVRPDPVTVMGLPFPNRVGLAAGLDKDGRCIDGLAAMGFGFVEVGTVTPRAQPGNPAPRLFRLPAQEALINRMGFNNDGVDALARRVHKARFDGILGINIGKNFDTPVEHADEDYTACMRKVFSFASYITVNVSSPNTPGLRDLQTGDSMRALLTALREQQKVLTDEHERQVPLVVKIAPDMAADEITAVCAEIVRLGIDGLIVGNTTLDRAGVSGQRHAAEKGGLSGAPLKDKADSALAVAAEALAGRAALIGVGGILSGSDAADKIRLGADLVQVYTGFIYRGPDLIADAVEAIRRQNN